ncbi:hypothetical protein KIL84_014580 [Mauremys mutica]|uniref:Uncharacterized protein n=1 Tax=Mauremys mutica TaxID=74926 RepID=A0A9D3XNP7_9SAUR|nr:hypothetical protein KIL84_014580 [Mauremys mutica]
MGETRGFPPCDISCKQATLPIISKSWILEPICYDEKRILSPAASRTTADFTYTSVCYTGFLGQLESWISPCKCDSSLGAIDTSTERCYLPFIGHSCPLM